MVFLESIQEGNPVGRAEACGVSPRERLTALATLPWTSLRD
jgi:hypothetical protein